MNNKLLSLLLKEKLIIISGVTVGFLLFLVYYMTLYTPLYNTNIQLFVRNVPKNDIITNYGANSTVYSESGFSNPLLNLVQVLESHELSTNIYKALKDKYPEDLKRLKVKNKDDFYKVYTSSIKGKIEPSTDVIQVSFNWLNKKNIGNVLNETINQFKSTNLNIRKSVEKNQRKYLDLQIVDLGEQLDNIRDQIKRYKLDNKIVNAKNSLSEVAEARIEIEKNIQDLKGKIAYNSRKFNELSSMLSFNDAGKALRATGIGQDEYLVKLNQDLALAQQNYARLQTKFTDNYPDLIAVKNEINSLQKNIASRELQTLGNVNLNKRGIYDDPSQEMVADFAKAQADKRALKSQLQTLMSNANILAKKEYQIPKKVFGLQKLEKQEEALSDAYTIAKQKQLEAKIKENQIVDNIVPLGDPTKPTFSLSNLLMKFVGFLMTSLVLSLGVAWIKEEIDDKWESVDDLERITGEQVLGVIPWVKNVETQNDNLIYTQNSVMGIAYANLIPNIISKSNSENLGVISLMSTVPFRGESVIARNIAANIARTGNSVIVVDIAPINSSKLWNTQSKYSNHLDMLQLLDQVNSTGDYSNNSFQELLEAAVIPVYTSKYNPNSKFHCLCTGDKKVESINDYIASRGFRTLINYLRTKYEYIFIETPDKPFIYPEIGSILRVSDAAILFAGMRTSKQELLKTVDFVNKTDTNILGIISREEKSDIEKLFMPYEDEFLFAEKLKV